MTARRAFYLLAVLVIVRAILLLALLLADSVTQHGFEFAARGTLVNHQAVSLVVLAGVIVAGAVAYAVVEPVLEASSGTSVLNAV